MREADIVTRLKVGTRLLVRWEEAGDNMWYAAIVASKQTHNGKNGKSKEDWTGWYMLDFDGFDTDGQFFDLLQLARDGRLRHPSPKDEDLSREAMGQRLAHRARSVELRVKGSAKDCALRWELASDGSVHSICDSHGPSG